MAVAKGSVEVTFVRDLRSLGAMADEWDQLARNALEPNILYEPKPLMLALEHLARDGQWEVAVVRLHGKLIGLFPLQRFTVCAHSSRFILQMLRHQMIFNHTPLLDRDDARSAIRGLLESCAQRHGPGLIVCPRIQLAGHIPSILRQDIEAIGGRFDDTVQYERPLFVPAANSNEYLERTISRQRRRRIAKQWDKLSDLGTLSYDWLNNNDDIEGWIDRFIKLESSGWKGKTGSAIECRPSRQEYFRRLITFLHDNQRVVFGQLTQNRQPIAMAVILRHIHGDSGIYYMTAYDERYRPFSPGIILDVELIKYLHDMRDQLHWIDSCSSPGPKNVLMELWSERTTAGRVMLELPGIKGRVATVMHSLVTALAQGNKTHFVQKAKRPFVISMNTANGAGRSPLLRAR